MEAVADLALLESGPREVDWEIPAVTRINAKKT